MTLSGIFYSDWYIELTKPRIAEGGETKETAQAVLVWVMQGMLKLLHPFMPYITEEIWQEFLPMKAVQSWCLHSPVYEEKYSFAKEEEFLSRLLTLLRQYEQEEQK